MTGRLLAAAVVALAAGFAAACGSDGEQPPAQPGTATTTALELPFPEASVTCDGETTHVGTMRARAQPDGIHLRVDNTSGRPLGWSTDVVGRGGQGASAPPGESTHVLDLPPGALRVACFDERRDDPSEVSRARVEVVDEDGVWVSTELACDGHTTLFADHAAGALGEQGAPVEVVRRYLDEAGRLRSGDRLEKAGYQAVDQPARVRLVRHGEVVAVFGLASDGHGGWLLEQTDFCTDRGLD